MAGDLEHIIPGGPRGLIEEKHQAAGETPDQNPEVSHGHVSSVGDIRKPVPGKSNHPWSHHSLQDLFLMIPSTSSE
jgi:hypothetical protein